MNQRILIEVQIVLASGYDSKRYYFNTNIDPGIP
jgi:hypothetical protein